MKLALLGFIWLLLWPPGLLYGHGLSGEVAAGGVVISFRYSSGEVMSFAKVTVVSPADGKTFQVGNTDRQGRFCFYPNTPGNWQVTADDGQGHRLTLSVPVTAPGQPTPQSRPGQTSILERALVGVSLIFGLTGIFALWQNRRKPSG